jgi:membrane protein
LLEKTNYIGGNNAIYPVKLTIDHKNPVGVFLSLLKKSFEELSKNDPLRMAGATAFFTTFALPPIMIILIQALGLIFDPDQVSRQLFSNLAHIIGKEGVNQILNTLKAFSRLAENFWITIGGFIFLLFVATTLFKVIKGSLNQLWKIRSIGKRSFYQIIISRFNAIVVIIFAGVLFSIGLFIEAVQAFLGHYIFTISPVFALYFNHFINYILSIGIVTLWFAILFRYLPDARSEWRTVLAGGFVTSILFNTGKFMLRFLLSYNNLNTIFGASASIVLLLLFVFYSSLILYFGAAFTRVWSFYKDRPIKPLPHAMHYRLVEATEEY